ncbi:tigger transposable element-derived protein 4-like [Montipora foliosa]|uniref:tigger transposable element-derived protein 4-like n=1 Tax=Montipora foliosa TaxID=591990 RepID=UPI0035F13A99
MDQGVILATKAYFRQGCVKKFIDVVDNKKPLPNLSILDAMAILTEAWGRVSEKTMRNCFRKAGIGSQAQQSALNDDDDPFKILLEDITALRERSPELVPDEVSAEDVVDTDSGVLTSDIGSLSDEDILAEFCEENQMEVDDGDDGNEDEQQEETPKRPTKSEVPQAIETPSWYSFFAVEGAEIQQTSQLSITIDKSIRKKQKQQNIQRFCSVTASVYFCDI